jgi:hypothetical protein
MARGPLAGASGPGKYSKRTDMSLGSTSYGEGGETAALNTAAPKSKTRGIADDVGGRPANPMAQAPVTPLFSQSQRPEEPITNGIDMGAGAGSEALAMRQPDDTNFRASITSYMPVLTYISDLPNTSPETRKAIRQLRDQL